jgi:hypothetical protein
LDELMQLVDKPRTTVVRAIIMTATAAQLPAAWRQVAADERAVIAAAELRERDQQMDMNRGGGGTDATLDVQRPRKRRALGR